jgi:hypothetical protein
MKTTFLLIPVLLGLVAHARAEVELPHFFSDHMVLQRDKPASIWGTADAGASVTVTLIWTIFVEKSPKPWMLSRAWKSRFGRRFQTDGRRWREEPKKSQRKQKISSLPDSNMKSSFSHRP